MVTPFSRIIMEPLPQTYFRDNKTFRHELLKRTEPGVPNGKAIYKVFLNDGAGTHVSSYEMFWIKIQMPTTMMMGGKEVNLAHKELTPGNNTFGMTAWSYGGIGDEKALKLYEDMKPAEVQLDENGKPIHGRGRPKKVN